MNRPRLRPAVLALAALVAADCIPATAAAERPLDGECDQSASAQLAMGECLTVHIQLVATIEATAPGAVATLGAVTFRNAGEGAGATCLVDDGRGA